LLTRREPLPSLAVGPAEAVARSLRRGMRADPVRGFAAGTKPETAGESADSPKPGGEFPDASTHAGRRGHP
jgi:hypothetical protein